jgi:Cu-Zn family superoxide dismutase
MRIRTLTLQAAALTLMAGAFGCTPSGEPAEDEGPMNAPTAEEQTEPVTEAVAVLHPTEGSDASGIAHFVDSGMGIRVIVDMEGLSPGDHGFHVHEFGDCSAPDGTSAGGHFNPDGQPHGAPTATERHVGDHLEWTDTYLSFAGPHSILGRGVIVHAGADDFTSQPTGNAGGRVACGVIGIARGDM